MVWSVGVSEGCASCHLHSIRVFHILPLVKPNTIIPTLTFAYAPVCPTQSTSQCSPAASHTFYCEQLAVPTTSSSAEAVAHWRVSSTSLLMVFDLKRFGKDCIVNQGQQHAGKYSEEAKRFVQCPLKTSNGRHIFGAAAFHIKKSKWRDNRKDIWLDWFTWLSAEWLLEGTLQSRIYLFGCCSAGWWEEEEEADWMSHDGQPRRRIFPA